MKKIKVDDIQVEIREDASIRLHDQLVNAMLQHPETQTYLKGTKYQVLGTYFYGPDAKERALKSCKSRFSDFYEMEVYNYTKNYCLVVRTNPRNLQAIELEVTNRQPIPNQEEFDYAVKILLKQDEKLQQYVKNNQVQLYRTMPPTVNTTLDDGTIQRTLTVGIRSSVENIKNQIIGVNMILGKVLYFEGGAPPFSSGGDDHCGVTGSPAATTQNAPGQHWTTVKYLGNVIWKFLVVRPAASSGTNGSGVELKFVDYKGKRVLYQAHVPILNVRYDGDACGPYRDWQNEEGPFEAFGNDLDPGIRLCNAHPKTILDSGVDGGNFTGVAIYVDGLEVVLVSQMVAGWYRYISEWRLHVNGTIKPRFGFSAVQNACVCKVHHHHVYWRLDFDVETTSNIVEEYNNPPIFGSTNWHQKSFEIRRLKDSARKRKWKISNPATGSAYELRPGSNDGVADSFGVGDFWVVRYHGGTEIDDGIGFTTDPAKAKAHIDDFVNGESTVNKDVVIWYGAHFTHDFHQIAVGHIVGPDLVCVKW